MKVAVSNIAWTAAEDALMPGVLRASGADAIEVAPGRLFSSPSAATSADAAAVRAHWEKEGLPVVSMQALLFGRDDLRMFGPPPAVDAFVAYLSRIIALAGDLGCGPLVFGSPGNRRRGEMDFETAVAAATPTLRRLGEVALANGCVFCLEANASAYGCDFMTRIAEAAAVVRAVDHPAVRLVVDTGNMQMEDDSLAALEAAAPLVSHLHLSMPQLGPVDGSEVFLGEVVSVMRRLGYDRTLTAEMRPPRDGSSAQRQIVTAVTAIRKWIGQ